MKHKIIHGGMCYYIGSYLLPALAGKLFGWDASRIILLFYSYIGILFTFAVMRKVAGAKTGIQFFGVYVVLVLFSTFTPLNYIYNILRPDDISGSMHWMSSDIRIQYSSNIILLRWFFAQCIPAWLSTALLMYKKEHFEIYGLIIVPIVLYSAFAFVGISIIAFLYFVAHFF